MSRPAKFRAMLTRAPLGGAPGSTWGKAISVGEWTYYSAEELAAGDEQDPTMPEDWRGQVLKHLLPRVYPTMSGAESLRTALSDQSDMQSAAALQSIVQAEIGRQIKAAAALRTSLRDLERVN